MRVVISSKLVDRLRDEAETAAPQECCGILHGVLLTRGFIPYAWRIDDLAPARNVAQDPETRFEIDPQALIDAERAMRTTGPMIVGYYHSHPNGRAEPSATDRQLAPHDGRVWAIAAPDGVTFWHDDEHGFTPLSYALEDG